MTAGFHESFSPSDFVSIKNGRFRFCFSLILALLLHASCWGSLLCFLFLALEHLKEDYQQCYE
jgi:hypothetical protein